MTDSSDLVQRPTLREIAQQVPLGFECRSCGASAYNWLSKCALYEEGKEVCCANFKDWIKRATAIRASAQNQTTSTNGELK